MTKIIVLATAGCLMLSGCGGDSPTRLAGGDAPAASLFDPAVACERNSLGQLWKCDEQSATLRSATVTPSTDPFLRAITLRNRMTFEFVCSSSQPLRAYLATLGASQPIILSPDPAHPLQSTPWLAVAYEGTDMQMRIATPAQSTVVSAGCRFVPRQNITVPHVPSLAWYLEDLKGQADEAIDLSARLGEAAELPAKWAYVRTMPQTLSRAAMRVELELEILEAERAALAARGDSGEALTAYEASRKTDLSASGGVLDLKRAEAERWQDLSHKVAEVLAISAACGEPAAPAQCLRSVDELQADVDLQLEATKARLAELGAFIDAERLRLASVASATAAQLAALLQP